MPPLIPIESGTATSKQSFDRPFPLPAGNTDRDFPGNLQALDVSALREELARLPVVIFGAGNLGKRILRTVQAASISPAAFVDNNPNLWGRTFDSIPILNPADAAQSFGDRAIFVIAIWHPAHTGGLRGVENQLRDLGCGKIVPFIHVLWAFPGSGLPHYLWDLPSKLEPEENPIRQAYDLFEDEESRREFRAQVAFRLNGDFLALPPIQNHPQYFAEFLKPAHREVFIDCGAYDGDSVGDFLHWSGGRFQKVIAFEPDPNCYVKLQNFVSLRPESRGRIECQQFAVAETAGVVRFDATGSAGAAISDCGSIEVKTVALDRFLAAEAPTFIKMDIEGAEPSALRGAKETIRRSHPILAVYVYHEQNHLWRLPLLMKELQPDAQFFLRSYCLDGLDTVCYAVPRDRLASR